MISKLALSTGATLFALFGSASLHAAAPPTDPEIAHVAYTAGQIDIAAAEQALAKSKNGAVRAFAEEMVRDHKAVNEKALALVKKLQVTPKANATSESLEADAKRAADRLSTLSGSAFDRAYADNEVAYHRTVNGALGSTLIPSAANAELKELLKTGLTLFQEHQKHAEQLAKSVR